MSGLHFSKEADYNSSSLRLKKGRLITVMISNFPKGKNQYSLDSYLKSKGIIPWGCRINVEARVAFVDVEVKDSEKVFGLHEDDWEGCELVVKLDETLQNKKQKTPKVSKEQKTEEKEERDNRTLCCKNVPYKIFSQKVMSLFKEVREVHLVQDKKTQKCTGVAFIEFFTEEAMKEAYEKRNEFFLDGRKLNLLMVGKKYVSEQFHKSVLEENKKNKNAASKQQPNPEEHNEIQTFMISNIPNGKCQTSLTKFLKTRGITLFGCRANFEARIAFVDVQAKDCNKLLNLREKKWEGCKLIIEVDETKKGKNLRNKDANESIKERTLCCKNLPLDVFAQKIEVLFKDVKEVRNLEDSAGNPTGMAFIEFFTKKGLKEAYSKKDNVELDGRKLKLSLSVPEETVNDPDFENESDDGLAMKSIFDTSIPRRYKKINRKRKNLKSAGKPNKRFKRKRR